MPTALADGLAIPAPLLLSGDSGALLSIPKPTLLAGDSGALLSIPAPTLIATVIMDSALLLIPAPTLIATGNPGSYNTSALIVPAPTLIAVASTNDIATAVNTVPPPTLNATGLISILASAALVLPAPTALIVGFAGSVGTALLTIPAPTLASVGYPPYTATFAGIVPIPQISAVGGTPVTVAFRTWVMNTRKGALTEYGPEFAFNSYAIYKGQVLACGANGAVVLGTQATDNGTAIDARWRTGKSNYDRSVQKRVPRVYANVSTDGDLIVRSITNEGGVRSYLLANNFVVGMQQRRVPIGKGPKSSYFQFEMENVAGSDFTTSSLLVYPVALRRRIS